MEESILKTLRDILVWTKASAFQDVLALLKAALPDEKSRLAYQTIDGTHSIQGVKAAAGMGQQAVYDLIDRCIAMGLMERDDKGKAIRLFDLRHFALLPADRGEDSE